MPNAKKARNVVSEASGDLERWWLERAQDEIERTIPKAIEYSSTDLEDIGRALLPDTDLPGHLYTEAGVAFYALGKVSRVLGALKEGREPNEDSWFDLGVYARMAQRARSHGGWPGVTL